MRVKLVVWYKIAVYIVHASRFYMYTYLVVIKVDLSVKLKIPTVDREIFVVKKFSSTTFSDEN